MSESDVEEHAEADGQGPLGAGQSPAATTLALAFLGAVTMYVVQPPLKWAPLALIAAVPWLLIVRMPCLTGKRPLWALYFAGFVHHLLLTQGIRHPHWALVVGWIAMSAYLALYPLLFIVLARRAVHRGKVPIGIAAPAVWVALEFVRAYALTGYGLALFGHSVVSWPMAIQVADLGGAYLVSALLMLANAALVCWIPWRANDPSDPSEVKKSKQAAFTTAAAALAIVAALGYGSQQLKQTTPAPTTTVALVQGARDVFYEYDPKANQEMFLDYRFRTRELIEKHPEIKLAIWPESSLMANLPEVIIDGDLIAPITDRKMSDSEYQRGVQAGVDEFHARMRVLARDADPRGVVDLLVCGETIHAKGREAIRYNAAVLLRGEGKIEKRYYKMLPVMFGEYIPLGETFPWIYDWTPMYAGMSRGPEPVAMSVDGLTFSPSICFETTIPHLIRKQIATLRAEGKMPDVLLNPTNDGWFHGSSILDLHANCMVFRAVENRRPLLAPANGGLTSWIDAHGRIQGRLPRKTKQELLAQVGPAEGVSIYQRVGDAFAWLCVAVSLIGLAIHPPSGQRRE